MSSRALTYQDYAALPDDGRRYQILDGELCVTPAPGLPHQEISGNLFAAIYAYVKARGLGKVFAAPLRRLPMGTFFVQALVAAQQTPEHREPVELRVDSGSTYTWIASARLHALSVVPTERRRVVTIEGQVVERDAAEVLITLDGRTLHTICLFGNAGDLDVLGALTLEEFALGVDPVQRKLIPVIQYGAAAA